MADDLNKFINDRLKVIQQDFIDSIPEGVKLIPKQKEINLYVLVDSGGYICYTSKNEELVKNYKDSNCFTDKTVVKLTGFLPQGE